MYHNTIAAILSPLKTEMKTFVIYRYPNGHFHWVIYDLAAYIADYLKQVQYILQVLFKISAQSIIIHYPMLISTNYLFHRCTAMLINLDSQAGHQSHVLTCKLKEIINLEMLWDEYGIDNDIKVCYSLLDFNWSYKIKLFITHFSCTNIHEMLLADILH